MGAPPDTAITVPRRLRSAAPRALLAAAVLATVLSAAVLSAAAPRALAAAAAWDVRAHATGRTWASHTPVPILMYHHVQASRGGHPLMYVGNGQFARQLRYLRDHGYHPVTMQRVWEAWNDGTALPLRPVVLSFDDGYIDQYANAARILRPYRWPAVLNLVVRRGTTLTDAKVRRMVAWGWEIGSHTMDHKVLTKLSPAALRRQLQESRRILRKTFHQRVDFFCYPYGEYNARVERAVEKAGYLAAVEVKYGAAVPTRRWAMKRVAVYWGESLAKFGERMRDAVAQAR